jgi:hypothetical protein
MSRSGGTAPVAKPAAPQPAALAQTSSPAQVAAARKPNGAGQPSTKAGAPTVAT